MNERNTIQLSQNEKIMAALSHITAMLPMLGLIAPIVIWVTQKEKSKYAAFQALQATAYQLFMIFAYFLGMGCYMASFFGIFLTTFISGGDPSTSPGFLIALPFSVFGLIFVGGALFILYGIIAAVLCIQGKDFKYFIIGDRVERFLAKEN